MCYRIRHRAIEAVCAMLLCIGSVGGSAALLDFAAMGGTPVTARFA